MSNQAEQPVRDSYPIDYWSDGFFAINDNGEITVETGSASVSLKAIIQQCQQVGLKPPILLRFNAILHQRVQRLKNAFTQAMQDYHYQQQFTPVYPIKVNQQYQVVQELLNTPDVNVGLEAGSKPELLAVLGVAKPNSVIVCNGYKDQEYLHLALIAQQLGHRVYIILEKNSELDLLLPLVQQLKIKPLLGIRVRLAAIGAGKWQNTGGEKAKFGLTADQVLQAVSRLKQAELLPSLQLLHCHMGSQIANIHDIQNGMHEFARYYADLHQLGCSINTVDVGGGLGVDYEGTRSRKFCSMNYSLQQYANAIVHALDDICQKQDLPQPHIFTESGRAMTAHHAVLITNVIAEESAQQQQDELIVDDNAPQVLKDLWQCYTQLSQRPLIESYHDASHCLQEAYSSHRHGLIDLAQRAQAERLYSVICQSIYPLLNSQHRGQQEIKKILDEKLATKCFANFSLFQSMPDAWAIQQVFPVLPLTDLNQPAGQRIKVQDITCDSDGQIYQYVDGEGIETSLPVPTTQEPMLLGLFLVGAYQEILGDMHNLFGDTDSVHVVIGSQGQIHLEHALKGDTVSDVLRYVHFDMEALVQSYQHQLENADLALEQRAHYLQVLLTALDASTYLETTTCSDSLLPPEKVS